MKVKKILFASAYFYKLDPKQLRMAQPYPPLMTMVAASYLREAGYDVMLFDAGLKKSAGEIEPILASFEPDYVVIFDDGFNYLTKMCLTVMREAAFEMQRLGKQYGATVITCSSDSTDHYEKYLAKGADYVLAGEGEMSLHELLKTLDNTFNVEEVPGVIYSNEHGVLKTQSRPVLRDLDQLPTAAWDLVDIEAYRDVWLGKHRHFYLNVATTRGCPYKCNWCAKPIYGNRYNTRSPFQVVEEIELLHRKYGVDHFWMCDDIFGLKPGWVQGFRDELEARKLKIKYKIQSRVDLLLQEDNIEALVDSGLDEAWVGAESGSQRILDAMDKGTKIEQIEAATQLLKSKGVKVGFFIQFGYLGETKEDIEKTVDMVLKLMPHHLGVSVSYPLPGTKFHDIVKSQLRQKANWTDSDDLDLMFRNTYPKDYYKHLHRLLHGKYRLKSTRKKILEGVQKRAIPSVKTLLKIPYYQARNTVLQYKLDQIEKHNPSV